MCEAVVRLSREVSKQDEASPSDDICWICHEGHAVSNPLEQLCECKGMKIHRPCLSRWQLQNAGKLEERLCRFCKSELPDWRDAHGKLPKASPVMTVVHNGVTHQVKVEPGPLGKQRFHDEIRKIFNLGPEDCINLTFGCRVPSARANVDDLGQDITLEGWEAFDASVHCASISAGQRAQTGEGTHHQENLANTNPKKGHRRVGVLRRMFSRTMRSSSTE